MAFTGPRLLSSTRGPARSFFRWAGPALVGQSVLKEAGVWKTVQNPDANRCAAAQRVFLGGHRYEIDADLVSELTAAGYGAYIA